MYTVKTHVSSFDDGRQELATCETLDEAIQECAEWADFDDIYVWVEDAKGDLVYAINGYAEAQDYL